jgi:inorganic pyrophosphatase
VRARPIGVLDMRDDKGQDHKVLAVPIGDPRFDGLRSLSDVPEHWLREIENFFETYKRLEDKFTEVLGWDDVAAAWQIIDAARAKYSGDSPRS